MFECVVVFLWGIGWVLVGYWWVIGGVLVGFRCGYILPFICLEYQTIWLFSEYIWNIKPWGHGV
jgi:hypothetical protein